ncbi:hypothetical protein R1sor_009983 [Riccia sorocarpa]|uniref:Uncharacterized protein n=1 Tax=Riccia sorocarpa TaxID=122646 RepID=A0ABD3I0B6_9MARC
MTIPCHRPAEVLRNMASQQGDGAHASDEGDGVGNSPSNYTEATFTKLVDEADAIAEEVVFFDVTVRQYGVDVEESDIISGTDLSSAERAE